MPGTPLVVVGPTAAGKSALALAVAERTGAEIVSADAMAVYRGMDVGTAKPTPADRARVRHHGLDLVEPTEELTVVDYQHRARAALVACRATGTPVVVVGGTGLYVRALVDDLEFPGRFPEVAAELGAEPDTAALHARLARLDPAGAVRMEPTNRRRVLRALEVTLGSGRPFSAFGPGLDRYPERPFRQLGVRLDRADLDARITARYDAQMAAGFLAEVEALAGRPLSRTARQALGYKELLAHLAGEVTLADALDLAVRRTRRFARRQERWFRRDPRVTWHDGPPDPSCVVSWWKQRRDPAPGLRD
jgi:tRNA dimethylallyltransferase